MAIDEALLVEADRSGGAFLRLYRFTPPCLSFGRNEPALVRYDRAAIERRGLHVVRRPTGGRAVWHEHEVTYAVAAPIATFGSLSESYQEVHQRLAGALQRLGIRARLAPRPVGRISVGAGACFATAVGGEIVVDGKKVVGSAQVRRGKAFLQHGSILLDGSQGIVDAVSYQSSAVSGCVSLSEVLGRPVAFEEVADAIQSTWFPTSTPTVPYRPLPSPTPPSPTPFADPDWTWRR